jgi:hypothetical protein
MDPSGVLAFHPDDDRVADIEAELLTNFGGEDDASTITNAQMEVSWAHGATRIVGSPLIKPQLRCNVKELDLEFTQCELC